MEPIPDSRKGSSSLPGVVEWKPTYSLGIASIDKQHKMLVSIIGHLQEAMLEGRTKEVVVPLIFTMNRYTQYHFDYEEQLLKENGYPGCESHRDLHAGSPVMLFLKTWLVDHIGDQDQQFAAFLKEKGVF